MNRPAHARSISRRLLLAGLFAGAAVLILPRETAAQNYRTILDAGESQTPQGVRGADGADVLLACSYTISGSLLYTGPLSGTGGTWSQINVPSASTSGTVANTIPHSVMGSIAVGNYNLVAGGSSAALGNAFVYNIATDAWTIFDAPFGGTDKLTSTYGVWQNGVGSTSYTIAGGSADVGIYKAFLIDYDSATDTFTNLAYFYDGAPAGMTHFEGITGTPDGYNLIGIAGTGYAFASVRRNPDNSFGTATWTGPLSYPGSTLTTGNTVIGDQAIGIYTLPSSSDVFAYVATVPEPSALGLVAAGTGLAGLMRARTGRRKAVSARG